MNIEEKYEKLQLYFQSLGSAAIAFSGGVDSTFMLKAAHDTLGGKAIAVTVQSGAFPGKELTESMRFCENEGIHQVIMPFDTLTVEGFSENPPDRCYICKKAIFRQIQETARQQGIACVCEGSNMDDMGDYRPGMRAVQELGILSPLREAGLTKAEIRELSRMLKLPTWSKPSYACLATRFVYGEEITREKLHMVEEAENLLIDMGMAQMRVRMHGTMARIEVLPEHFPLLMEETNRRQILERFRKLGFSYVTLDLAGYRMGSMNEQLKKDKA